MNAHASPGGAGELLDETLVPAAIAGDRAAISELWMRHRRWVAVVLLAHKPAAADLDDLLQEVAATLVARVGDVRDSKTFRAWLRVVAVNAARAVARSSRLRITVPIDGERVECGGAGGSGGADDARDEASRLLALVDELPEAYREPLLLRSLQDMSTRQVAALLDVAETTIETRVSRGRRMLRELHARREAHALHETAQAAHDRVGASIPERTPRRPGTEE